MHCILGTIKLALFTKTTFFPQLCSLYLHLLHTVVNLKLKMECYKLFWRNLENFTEFSTQCPSFYILQQKYDQTHKILKTIDFVKSVKSLIMYRWQWQCNVTTATAEQFKLLPWILPCCVAAWKRVVMTFSSSSGLFTEGWPCWPEYGRSHWIFITRRVICAEHRICLVSRLQRDVAEQIYK